MKSEVKLLSELVDEYLEKIFGQNKQIILIYLQSKVNYDYKN